MNKPRCLLLSVVFALAAVHFGAQPAPGSSVSTYDFESCTAGYLNGQDNWAASSYLKVATAPMGGAPHPGSGLCLTSYGGAQTMYGRRENDSNWGFDLTGAAQFAMGNSMAIDYYVSGYYGVGEYRIRNTTTAKSIGFGITVVPWEYAVYVRDAAGDRVLGTFPHTAARNQVWDFRMEVDAVAYGGNGAAALLAKLRGIDTEWQQVGGLESVDLKLLDTAADIQAADQLYVVSQVRLTAMDDLWVEYVAGLPVTVGMDIKPGSDPNSINLMAQGLLPVAILGSDTFDVSQIDQTTVAVAGASPEERGESGNFGAFDDVNGDGFTDLMLRFPITGLSFEPGATEATLVGELLDGSAIEGSDLVRLLHPGDANDDGLTNLQDFTIMKSNFGLCGKLADGDFNEDGIVNLADFSILKTYFGTGSPAATAIPIPEPATMSLLALGAAALVRRRRR